MKTFSRWILSAPLVASLLVTAATPALSAPHHAHRSHSTADLPQIPPSTAHQLNNPPEKNLTPAQQVALPDGGAPPPPHGYVAVEDSEERLANFSGEVRTHLPVGMPGTNAEQKTNGTNNLPSHFSIFGMPVKFNTPVTAPYHSEDLPLTYAGHPSNGQTNVLVNGDASDIH
ncbi:MAG: hypothetical protein ABF542_08415 [Gluconobacter sp.]